MTIIKISYSIDKLPIFLYNIHKEFGLTWQSLPFQINFPMYLAPYQIYTSRKMWTVFVYLEYKIYRFVHIFHSKRRQYVVPESLSQNSASMRVGLGIEHFLSPYPQHYWVCVHGISHGHNVLCRRRSRKLAGTVRRKMAPGLVETLISTTPGPSVLYFELQTNIC